MLRATEAGKLAQLKSNQNQLIQASKATADTTSQKSLPIDSVEPNQIMPRAKRVDIQAAPIERKK
jgi:hypothetical protein